jgi:glucose/arabinose dehydrogenase
VGDDTPPGELNRATAAGQHFGYPWLCGKVRITEHGYDKDTPPADVVYPQVEMVAHAADLGLAFYTGTVPGQVPGRHLLGPARLLEPHHAHGGPDHVHVPEA